MLPNRCHIEWLTWKQNSVINGSESRKSVMATAHWLVIFHSATTTTSKNKNKAAEDLKDLLYGKQQDRSKLQEGLASNMEKLLMTWTES